MATGPRVTPGSQAEQVGRLLIAVLLALWLPALPGGIKPEWALTGLTILAPAMGWVKGANGARLALASSGMAAAQASDFFSK